MSVNKPIKKREAGRCAFPKDTKPTLRLVRPASECLTLDLALNMPREVKEMLREMNRKRRVVKKNDTPDAA
ncbi:MAG: hypothetical protein M3R15_13120 [Acidobacteriota bacterium]|nr:hypothetical protein [Acidobacteriota bacterium]